MLLLLLLSVLTVMLLLLRGVTVGVTGKGRFRAISGRFRAKSGRFQAIPSDFKRFRAISSDFERFRAISSDFHRRQQQQCCYCYPPRLNVNLLLLKSLLFLTLLITTTQQCFRVNVTQLYILHLASVLWKYELLHCVCKGEQ